MKKILILALLCVGIYWCFNSCIGCDSSEEADVAIRVSAEDAVSVGQFSGNSSPSTPSQYGNDYKKACEDLNFKAAHRILDNMDYYSDRIEAERYIFKKESMYLLSLNTEDAKQRILFLFKDSELEDYELYDIIKVVIEMDDVQFTKRLIEQSQTGGWWLKKQDILNYLIKQKDAELSDIILYQLMVSKGSLELPPMSEGIIESSYDKYYSVDEDTKEHNVKCNNVLATAIKHKNKYLAERTIALFTKDYYVMPIVNGNNYKLSTSSETIKSAKAILQSALYSGTID